MKFDLTQAYKQLALEEDSRQYVVINTAQDYFVTTDFCSDYRQCRPYSNEYGMPSPGGYRGPSFTVTMY